MMSRIVPVSLVLIFLAGCQRDAVPSGSLQDQSASATARAESNARAADSAVIDAASKSAKADALEQAAKVDPTPARIEAAVAARVDAASSKAVADALAKVAKEASASAKTAAEDARKERDAEAAASDLRHWVNLCRWFGLIGVAAGAILGGVLGYFIGPMVGVPMGALIAGTGLLVVAFGSTVTWLPLVLGAAVIAGLVVWFIAHERTWQVGVALSRTVDAVQGGTSDAVAQAKDALGKAVERSGLGDRFDRLREAWKTIA